MSTDDTNAIGFQPEHTPYPPARGKGVIPKHRGEQPASDARAKMDAPPLRKVSDTENCRPPPCRRR